MKQTLLLILLLVLTLSLRLFQIQKYMPWEDERISISCAVGIPYRNPPETPQKTFSSQHFWQFNSPPKVVSATILDNGNALFYNLSLHYWIKIFGFSDVSVRLFSILIGLLVVVLTFLLTYKIYPSWDTAYLSALLLSLHPLMVLYSQEIRGLQLATLLSLSATYLFLYALNSPQKRLYWLAYACCGFLSLMTTYLSIYVLILHGIYILWKYRQWKILWSFGGVTLGIMLCFGGWMWYGGWEGLEVMQQQYAQIQENVGSEQEDFWLKAEPLDLVIGSAENLAYISGNFLQTYGLRVRHFFPLLFLPFFLAYLTYKNTDSQHIKLLLGLGFGATLFFFSLSAISGHIAALVFFYCQLAVPYMMIIWAISAQHKWGKWGLALGLLVMMFSARFYIQKNNRVAGNDIAKFSAKVVQQASISDTLICPDLTTSQFLSLYLTNENSYLCRVEKGIENRLQRRDSSGKVLYQLQLKWE